MNIDKLNYELNKLFKDLLDNYKRDELKNLLSDLLHEKNSKLINERLKKYSKTTLRLLVERNILLSMENCALKYNKSYFNVLKKSTEKLNINILHHYFDTYISDIKNNTLVYNNEKSIEELKSMYNNEIKESLMNIDEISSINLDHMQNLNANGRTISINNNGILSRKGGIFLDKKSKVGYGKYVNKSELLNIITKMKKIPGVNIENINIKDLKIIIKSMKNTIKIDSNDKIKNQDARIISVGDKKAGSMFLGNKGVSLPNGEYVSMEEVKLAINKFISEKDTKPKKVIKIIDKFKYTAAVASLSLTALMTLTAPKTVSASVIVNEVESENNIEKDVLKVSEKNFSVPQKDTNVLNNSVVEKVQVSSAEQKIFEEKVESNITNDEAIINEVPEVIEQELDEIIEPVAQESLVLEQNIENISNEIIEEPVTEEIMTNENLTPEESIDDNEINPESNMDEENISSENESISEELHKTPVLEKSESVLSDENINNSSENNLNEETKPIIDGNEVVDYALQFVGNPYVYGGTSLTEGTDCSGFTSGIYSNFGIELPRTSAEQRKSGVDLGTDIENALTGDIICFEGHVGIYIGNGQMVHAANPKKGIVINDVNYDKPIKAIIRPNVKPENLEITEESKTI